MSKGEELVVVTRSGNVLGTSERVALEDIGNTKGEDVLSCVLEAVLAEAVARVGIALLVIRIAGTVSSESVVEHQILLTSAVITSDVLGGELITAVFKRSSQSGGTVCSHAYFLAGCLVDDCGKSRRWRTNYTIKVIYYLFYYELEK